MCADIIAEKDQQLADLEAKLAESESKRKSLEEKIKFLTEETEENFVDGQKYNQLKHQLEKSEKSKESYRLQNEQHHLQLMQFYSRLGVEAFGADIHEKALETLMIMKEQLAEKEKEIAYLTKQVKKFNNEAQKYFEDAYCNDFHNQDKISFAVDILEELAGCSNYINSKLDFECSSYVSEKAIRDKIKYLKGKKDE